MNDAYNVLADTEADFSDELSDIATKLEYFNNSLMTNLASNDICNTADIKPRQHIGVELQTVFSHYL